MSKNSVCNLIKAVAFFTIFILIVTLLGPVFIPKENTKNAGIRNYAQKVFHGEPKNTIDVLALGNSNLYRSFSPMEVYGKYGIAGFNCALTSARTVDLYYMLKDVLSCQKPKLLILEVDAAYRDAPDYEVLSSPLSTHLQYMSDFVAATEDDIAGVIGKTFPAIEYHNRWKSLSLKDFTKVPDYSNKIDPCKGFIINGKINPYKGVNHMEQTDDIDVIQPAASLYMDKILELCKENHIDILFYESPSAKSWNYRRHNGIQKYADKYDIPFVDLNIKTEEVGIDWSVDTKDQGEHMNIYGAKKCTEYLGNYIAKNYKLPDRRKDNNYSQWNSDYKKYEKKVELVKAGKDLANGKNKKKENLDKFTSNKGIVFKY